MHSFVAIFFIKNIIIVIKATRLTGKTKSSCVCVCVYVFNLLKNT